MELEDWDDEDEMGLLAASGMAFLIGSAVAAIVSVSIAWNVASVAAEAFQKVKGLVLR